MPLAKKIFLNPITISLVCLTGLFCVLILGTLFGIRRIPDYVQTVQERLEPVYANRPVSQKITLINNGFNVLNVYMKNASLQNTAPLLFTLADSRGVTIRQINLSGYNIGDGVNVRLQFEPVLDSAGQSYLATFTAPQTNQGQPKIEVGFSNSGTMSYQAYYQPQNSQVLLTQLVALFKARFFSLQTAIALAVFLVAAVFMAKRLPKLD